MEYGKADIAWTFGFFQPDRNVSEGPTMWDMYQFEESDDNSEDRAFYACVSKRPDGMWDAEIEGAYWSEDWIPVKHAVFADETEAMEWCCSWAFEPEIGQGTHSAEYEGGETWMG